MKRMRLAGILVLNVAICCACSQAPAPQAAAGQAGAPPAAAISANPDPGPVPLEWVPPALMQLSAQAAVKSSFTLDRDMLAAAASLMSDSDTAAKQAVAKLDGVSVHLLRFGVAGMADPAAVESIRAAYHLRGWKHVVSTSNAGGPVHDGTTDVWVVLDGANVRGAVFLAETPKSLTLVTVAGNINPVDVLRLRGHFGIPRFDESGTTEAK